MEEEPEPQPIHDLLASWPSSYRASSAPWWCSGGAVVALFLQRLMARFLEGLGLEDLFERTGAATPSGSSGTRAVPRA